MEILVKNIDQIDALLRDQILSLYKANKWSSAEKPEALIKGLMNSHGLKGAWEGDQLVGVGNALSDGHLVVYYPHLLVHPDAHGKGVGRQIMEAFEVQYAGMHMQILVSDGETTKFYEKCGFEQAGDCMPMWKYQGHDHD